MADVPRDRLMAAPMIMRSDVDKPVYFSATLDLCNEIILTYNFCAQSFSNHVNTAVQKVII